jgi:4-cresol dehydrogenase (hydroxylating)
MKEFREELKIGAWNGSGALYGTRAQVAEAQRLLRRALKGKAQRLQFLDDRKLRIATMLSKPYEWISGWKLERTLAVLKPVYGLMKGIPTDHPLASTYWRKRTKPPADMHPDRDGCGLIWCSPVAPTDGAHARAVSLLASEITLGHGFEPAISITMLTERTLACIISLAYDRNIEGEDARAMACYKSLLSELAKQGYYSYRLSVGSMNAMEDGSGYSRVLHQLKSSLDPNHVLAPGRYLAPAAAPAAVSQSPASA